MAKMNQKSGAPSEKFQDQLKRQMAEEAAAKPTTPDVKLEDRKFWVSYGPSKDPALKTGLQVQQLIDKDGQDYSIMPENKEGGWRLASAHGFIPPEVGKQATEAEPLGTPHNEFETKLETLPDEILEKFAKLHSPHYRVDAVGKMNRAETIQSLAKVQLLPPELL